MDTTKKAWINAGFLLVTLIVNALGGLGFINGLSQKEVSDMFDTLITPSPSTFSIWGLIYSLLIISVIMMIVKDTPYYKKAVDKISTLFRLSCLLNILWIIAFSYVQIELSVVLIFLFVITLTMICIELLKINDRDHWLLPMTFGMYAGWLFIATVVNISAMLVKWGWNGFGIPDDIWAIIILAVAVILVVVVLFKNRNAMFPLPIALAYLGIYQNLRSPYGFNGEFGLLQNAALAGAIVLALIASFQFYRNGNSFLPEL